MELLIIIVLIVIPALLVWIRGIFREKKLKKEIERLKEHLHIQMEIDSKGNAQIKQELQELRKQNENLRITIQSLKSKPGRKEYMLLYIYDKVINSMIENNPTIAPQLKDLFEKAEHEVNEIDRGLRFLIPRIFRRSAGLELSTYTKQLIKSSNKSIDE